MTDLGAFFLSIAIIVLGFALDNGLTNIAKAIRCNGKEKE